ncbi:MAG: hypothetical protein M1834_003459 [Cirrosporium novae-zelandiae]|nr:MAG: hypothetical protein M1834_003459 [Cirrosporium novae-zelandiae]
MFFEGSLQDGISLAVRESKLVVCFIKDDLEESKRWEEEYLQDEEITPSLEERAVVLPLKAHSQEAGFLATFVPVDQIPTLVVIENGQLREHILPGATKDEFVLRVKTVISVRAASQSTTAIPTDPSHIDSHPAPTGVSTRVQEMLAERRIRLDADVKAKEAAARQEKEEKAKERRKKLEEEEEAQGTVGKPLTYAQQVRKQRQEEKKERERILKQIENDKQERREREERRRAAARAEGTKSKEEDSTNTEQKRATRPGKNYSECAIQVRLVDGGSIRSRFSAASNISNDVRKWIDEQRSDGSMPYTLKQILTPLPNRTIELGEEDQSLHDLGLCPNATLVMVPVRHFTEAYNSNGGVFGLASRGVSAGYNLISGGLGLVTRSLRTFLTATPQNMAPLGEEPSRPASGPQEERRSGTSSSTASSIRIKTLRDQEPERDDRQLYNGNQLNFEPNKDKKDGKED